MKRAFVVAVVVVVSVLALPETSSAGGSYGAVIEKGVRDCATDRGSGAVICFESPSVNSQSSAMFLRVWRAAHVHLTRWDTGAETLRVRAVSVTTTSSPTARPVSSYAASADHVIRELTCRDDFRFRASGGAVRLAKFTSVCEP